MIKSPPSGWVVSTLGACCSIVSGGTPKRENREYWGGSIPWVTPRDISDINCQDFYEPAEQITDLGLRKSSAALLPAGTVLMSSRAPIGLVAIAGKPMATNQGFKSLIPGPKLDSRFLYHAIKRLVPLIQERGNGATFKEVSKSVLSEIPVCFPKSLQQQRRIGAILDKADGIRRKRQTSLVMANEFLKSIFLLMFGDPVNNSKGFCVDEIGRHLSKARAGTQSGPFGSSLKKHEYVDQGVPVWGVDNVQQNYFVPDAKLFITGDKFEQLHRYSVNPGDVLISRAGTVGRMCIANPTVKNSIISTNLVRVVLEPESLLPEYFVSLFTYLPHRLGALKANNKESAFTFLIRKRSKRFEFQSLLLGCKNSIDCSCKRLKSK